MARLEVGRVVKPHGLSGEVAVKFTSNRPERTRVGATFDVELADEREAVTGGIEIVAIRESGAVHLVRFSGVDGRDAAERLRGARLFADELQDPDAFFVHELIGAEVFDASGVQRGTVTAVEANPASDLLVVEDRFYVPMRFVVQFSPRRIVVDAPAGIFE